MVYLFYGGDIVNERVRELRDFLGFNQIDFSKKINIGQSTLAMFETGQRALKDIHIAQICSIFNVSEDWLRYGKGEMFVQADSFSLDEYAKRNNLTDLEFDIVKGYISLDSDVRQNVITQFQAIFDKHSEIAATKEDSIDQEVESYRHELQAEQKGRILSVLDLRKEELG